MPANFEQDIAISFAGEDEEIARQLKLGLHAKGVSVFFAPSSQAQLLGERLEEVMARKYGPTSRYVVALVSESYPIKDWPRFELAIAHDEEKQRDEAFILPLLLSDKRMVQIPPDKGYLDLRNMELEEVVDILAEKVKLHRGELQPLDLFNAAFAEWKMDGYVPGTDKGGLFWRSIPCSTLGVDETEFLLRCTGRSLKTKREGMSKLAPSTLAIAATRLVNATLNQNFRLSAISYLGVADAKAAEAALWRVYSDESVDVNDRARAFELFWKCPSEKSAQEAKRVLVDATQPWQLRRAAATNVLGGGLEQSTEALLSKALSDARHEVRSRAVDAVLRFKLEQMVPSLIIAYQKERSRKGKLNLKNALRHFNQRSDVVEFGKRMEFGPAFFQPPPYVHSWVAETNPDWL